MIYAILLVLLTHVGWYDHKHLLWQCSREKSRIVKSIIQKKFMPILDRYRIQMPLDCPFHPHRDLLWWPNPQDEQEFEDELSFQWTCPFCGSTFLCSERLAIHWDEKHRKDLFHSEDSICLANYCDIMRCDVILANKRNRRNRLRSMVLSKNITDLKSESKCDPNLMKQLESRCQSVVRQCTQGLISVISAKDYRDIEYDLIASICSYLSCDRYFDDYSNESSNVPLTLSMIIGIVMIGGFCLCYYIVWILFDSGYKSRVELMSCESIEDKEMDSKNRKNSTADIKRQKFRSSSKPSIQESSGDEGLTSSDRPKIMITSPSTHRFFRSHPIYYYHSNHPNYPNHHTIHSSIEEDCWESCVDVPITRPISDLHDYPSSSTTATITATTATTQHSKPESVSRASSYTTSQSIQSNPYNR
ncbi:uncharacterized protein LOC128962472 [Oppia nitens]|uniref:uncharacterized protein LOC128962472 n=1 Tax=Oppia nitens TaxID=1686743 RepID=UPI0023DC61F2|nr:uncharacterized protein LOC128962472 [Oppia nitens]